MSSRSTIEIQQLNSLDAYKMLEQDPQSILIDVRTQEEWKEIGIPDLSKINKDIKKISLRDAPAMSLNKNFLNMLEEQVPDKNRKILFICRSGGRSNEAAIMAVTQKAYTNCINIEGGFEGSMSTIGWKNSNLPWRK